MSIYLAKGWSWCVWDLIQNKYYRILHMRIYTLLLFKIKMLICWSQAELERRTADKTYKNKWGDS